MGTNYYVHENVCSECNRSEQVHIGKSSCGWKFLFKLNKDYYTDITTLKKWLLDKIIFNEYEEEIKDEAFWEMVESKQKLQGHCDSYYDKQIDGYDFCEHEFS